MRETAVTVHDGRVLLDPGVLKTLRKTQGLSQETLAYACLDRRLCVSVASIKRAETGKPVLYRTARHLASMFGVEIDILIGKIGATAGQNAKRAELSQPVEQHAGFAQEDVIRYGVILQFAPLARIPILQISALIRQFGGEPRYDTCMTACFGMPQAFGSDSRRALLCAMALVRALWVDARQPIVLELQRWGEPVRNPPAREPLGNESSEPVVYVARSLVEQLSAWFEFGEAESASSPYRICLRVREPGETAFRGLAGRSIEVLQFRAVLDAVLECQDGHVIYVRGMAGIGKTRLLESFRVMARDEGFVCHDGEFHDFDVDNGSLLLTHLVLSLAGLPIGAEQRAASHSPMAAAALRNEKLPAESLVFLQALLGVALDDEVQRARYAAMSDRERRDGLQLAICDLMLRQAIRQPLLIGIEDLHWGDLQTLALLGRLMAATSDAPIVWLLTSRQEGDPLDATLRPNFPAALSVLDLAPLRPREAVSLAAQFADVDPTYRDACIERAQGHPLYLTQLLANRESEFPDSLRHLVQTRIDRLPQPSSNALRYAAVFGHRFELASLRRVLGDIAYVPEHEVRQMMVKEIDADTYAFVHDLVMQCVYESIPPGARQGLHRAVAAIYADTDLALHAQHLARAGDAQACPALLAAMREKLADYRYTQALELSNLCEGFAAQADERHQLALLRGRACAGLGRMSEACDGFQAALDLASSPEARIEAVLLLAPVLNALDRLADEERLIEATLPLARAIAANVEVARLLQLRGNIHFPQGDYLLCRQLHREALRHARQARHAQSEAQALSGIGDSYYAQGRMGRAYAIYDRCLRRCEADGAAHLAAGNLAARASTAAYLGLREQALRDSEDAVARAARIGNSRAEVFARLTAVWALSDSGQDAQAQEAVEHALALARRIGTSRFEAMLLEASARLALRRGDRPLAWEWVTQAAVLVDQLQLQRYVGAWVQGSIALIAPEPALRDRALAKGEELLTQRCLAHNALRFHLAAAELALLDKQPEQAVLHAQRLRALAQREPYAWIDHHADLIEQGSRWLQTGSADMLRGVAGLRQEGFAATMATWISTLPF
ncbi:ATP-binding protein [Trinickia dinghuensis]|uniref:XRE family transcriptional regulator n=1 Tax=Trinickia dinghuensis TaxID=2291023 RepID=A0A3D8JT45_9BURK|nr:helix-turn-helix domain-containing protein [Trinickia dinghuensis]RDU95942.1 XRE family transcriptional regulator [Trinickia dinghuensis]